MVCKVYLVSVCILAFITEVYNKPIFESGLRECFQQGCPKNTIACATSSKQSADKNNIINKTQCFGLTGDVLQNITTTEKNPFGSNVFYQGFRYSGGYAISNSGNTIADKNDKDSSYGESEDLNKYDVDTN